ncbi:type IV secretory system conjugative DNA transfer family protein [Claveliimonas bilis]|nr:type IV secretory system conjugative DNA transfer family protein [Claveliimonas bilis]
MSKNRNYDYESIWRQYANQEENQRFLSNRPEDLLKICDVYDFKAKEHPHIAAGIPVHYDLIQHKLYCLRYGPHVRISGESGNKKSRCVVRPKILSCVLNDRCSFVVNDPKGELYADPAIIHLLQTNGYEVHCINLRNFSGDGLNVLAPVITFLKAGEKTKANIYLEKFLGNLLKNNPAKDPFWPKEGQRLNRLIIDILKMLLINTTGEEEKFNLASVKSFIRMDFAYIKQIAEMLLEIMPKNVPYNPVRELLNILGAAENTVRSVIISASALIEEFAVCEALLKQISISTFEPRDMYKKPMALFFIIPDETTGMDCVASYLMDVVYQELIDEYTNRYRDKPEGAPKDVHFIIDECSNTFVPNLGSKVSISRSRQIYFSIVYQSDDGMVATYEKDWLNIKYNMKAHIFLGNSSVDVLKQISEEAGNIALSKEQKTVPAVSIDDLRHMKKTRTYKDALVIVGDYLYAAKLPDYEVYPMLAETNEFEPWHDNLEDFDFSVFTPENLFSQLISGEISFEEAEIQEVKKNSKSDKKEKNTKKTTNEEEITEDDVEEKLSELYDELFGGTEDDS